MENKLAQAIDFGNLYKESGLSGGKITFGTGLTISDIINVLLPYIFTGAGLVLLLYLLYGGFHLIFSGGDPKAIQEAKGKIVNALIGFIIIFAAYWIVQIAGKVLGIEGFQGIFKDFIEQ
jgi:hypothetical protein